MRCFPTAAVQRRQHLRRSAFGGIRISPPRDTGANTIDPSAPQVPPRGVGASARIIGGPPCTASFFSFPASKNASHSRIRRKERLRRLHRHLGNDSRLALADGAQICLLIARRPRQIRHVPAVRRYRHVPRQRFLLADGNGEMRADRCGIRCREAAQHARASTDTAARTHRRDPRRMGHSTGAAARGALARPTRRFRPLPVRGAHPRCRAAAAGILLQAAPQADARPRAGVAAGSAAQSGSRSRIAASDVGDSSSPANAGRPVSISYSTQPNAQMSVRLSTAWPRACSGLMYGGRAEDDARPRAVRHRPSAIARRVGAGRRRIAFGEAEVEHLDVPVRRDLDVGRLEIAMDDALLVRRLERLGDLDGDGERARRSAAAPRAMRSASVSPSTSSRTSARRAGRRLASSKP